MSDAFRPASAGDPIAPRISAEWFNGVANAVNTLRGGDVDLAQQQLRTSGHDGTTVIIVNKSGSDIDHRGGVLKIDGLYFSYADRPKQVYREPELKGVTPSSDDDNFVIVVTPIKNNQPGKGIHTGMAFCRLNVTDDSHTKAQPTTSTDYLASSDSGATVLWKETDTTGEQWALVLLGSGRSANTSALTMMVITTEVSAATGDISSITPGSGAAQSYETDPDTKARTPMGDPVDVFNYDTCQSFSVNTLIYAAKTDGNDFFEVVSAACCQLDA